MIPEFGHFTLIIAFSFALLLMIVPSLGFITKQRQKLWYWAIPLTVGQAFFLTLSFLFLAISFFEDDFSVIYVAKQSHSALPLIYKFCAIWGGHEGSLLLWVFLLGLWMVLIVITRGNLSLSFIACVLAVLGAVSTGFLLFILETSNPFLRLWDVPIDGIDLNPFLQDPGLVSHPPILYAGYVGCAVAFAFAIAALILGRIEEEWIKWLRPLVLLAWMFLTVGITLGSWWAYYELGWGGWWFWDPVENAALMPWLVGGALIHSLIVAEKRQAFYGWVIFLGIMGFALSLLGTFIVRSGLLISVHAFAVDPERGKFILSYLTLIVGGAFVLYAWRATKLTKDFQMKFYSKESLLIANTIIWIVFMATVLFGTLYPIILDVLKGQKISVGPPYFNAVLVPIIVPFLLLMALGIGCDWQSSKLLWGRKIIDLLASILLSVLLLIFSGVSLENTTILGLTLALFLIISTLQSLKKFFDKDIEISLSYWGMIVSHLGLAVTIIGITLVTNYEVEKETRIFLGEQVTVNNYIIEFSKLVDIEGGNYVGHKGIFNIYKNNKLITKVQPEKRFYLAQEMAMSETAIAVGWWADIYVALAEPFTDKSWAVRVYYKPFVRWIWGGGLFIALGALLAASHKIYRKKYYVL